MGENTCTVPNVLIIRSSRGLGHKVAFSLGGSKCRIFSTRSIGGTGEVTDSGGISIAVYSIGLPSKGKLRFME